MPPVRLARTLSGFLGRRIAATVASTCDHAHTAVPTSPTSRPWSTGFHATNHATPLKIGAGSSLQDGCGRGQPNGALLVGVPTTATNPRRPTHRVARGRGSLRWAARRVHVVRRPGFDSPRQLPSWRLQMFLTREGPPAAATRAGFHDSATTGCDYACSVGSTGRLPLTPPIRASSTVRWSSASTAAVLVGVEDHAVRRRQRPFQSRKTLRSASRASELRSSSRSVPVVRMVARIWAK